MTSLFFL
jgi:hypothetical protein